MAAPFTNTFCISLYLASHSPQDNVFMGTKLRIGSNWAGVQQLIRLP